MAKKVFKGWTPKANNIDDLIGFNHRNCHGGGNLEIYAWIVPKRYTKSAWLEADWPPKRVTITVEVED